MPEDWIRWENRYQTRDTPWETGHPSSELKRVVAEEEIAPCPALEVGCGTGNNAVWLAQQGFAVTAIDVSQLAIETAKKKAAAAGVKVRFITGNILSSPDLVGPFAFYFDRGLYHHLREVDLEVYLRLLERTLKPGALGLVLAGNARTGRTGPPVVTEEEIRGELGRVCEILRLREFYFDLVGEGGGPHLAWSCLLRREG